MLKGTALPAGIGTGRAFVLKQRPIGVTKRIVREVGREKTRFYQAVDVFTSEIRETRSKVRARVKGDEADILTAQIEIVRDVELSRQVMDRLERERFNLEYVFSTICDEYVRLFLALEDEMMRARAMDFADIKHRMLSILGKVDRIDLSELPDGSVLVADEITPSTLAALDPDKISGVTTQRGNEFSHSAILAQALHIPAVFSVDGLLDSVSNWDQVTVDSDTGVVRIHPPMGTDTAVLDNPQSNAVQLELESHWSYYYHLQEQRVQ